MISLYILPDQRRVNLLVLLIITKNKKTTDAIRCSVAINKYTNLDISHCPAEVNYKFGYTIGEEE